MFKKLSLLSTFLLFHIIIISNSQQQDIIVFPTDKELNYSCSDNVYQFQFDVTFSQKLEKIIAFEMEIPLPYKIPFKCILDGPKSNILCFHSFSNYVWSLSDNSRMELPYSFPEIEGIKWDYDSFLKKIYRFLWRTIGNCGLEFEINQKPDIFKVDNERESKETKKIEKKMEIVADIVEIYGGECHSSQYDYSFNMKLKLYDGPIVEELKNAKKDNITTNISLLHGLYIPILLGDKKQRGITTFRKDYQYKYAKCKYESEISQDNFDNPEGVIFECHLSINKYSKFLGPLQIKPFTDYLYISKTEQDGNIINNKIGIKFEILSGFEKPLTETQSPIKNPFSRNLNLNNYKNQFTRNLNINTNSNIKEPNFLILDSNLNIYMCPDKPILTIKSYNDGIAFGGINSSGSKYLFLIYGYLTNGYEYINDTLILMDLTKDEIKFTLKVTDNLEDPDHKRKSVKCYIPTGSSINKNELIEVKCIGYRYIYSNNNNTDILLNWNLKENNDFQNIIVNWPYDLTKKKHIFYYDIKGLSVKRDNFGCFGNKFFFYLYVYDLKAEPNISFNLPLVYPKHTSAVCKLYNSVTFKCIIDLRLKRLSKGGVLILPNNFKKYLENKEQNIVQYQVTNLTSPLEFQLPINEDCGDFKLIGALKDIGYTYLQVIIIIVCGITIFGLCILGIAFCIVYEIIHRNRKGNYYKHQDENSIPNVSAVSQKNQSNTIQ